MRSSTDRSGRPTDDLPDLAQSDIHDIRSLTATGSIPVTGTALPERPRRRSRPAA